MILKKNFQQQILEKNNSFGVSTGKRKKKTKNQKRLKRLILDRLYIY